MAIELEKSCEKKRKSLRKMIREVRSRKVSACPKVLPKSIGNSFTARA